MKRTPIATLENVDLGNGPESVKFAEVSLKQRRNIISSKMAIIGKNADGNDLYGVPPNKLIDVMAESLAASIINDDGQTRFKVDDIFELPGSVADKLNTFFTENVGLQGAEEAKKAKAARDEKAAESSETAENPS